MMFLWGLFIKYVVKTFIGRVVAFLAVLGVGLLWNNAVQRQKGAEQVITGSIEKGKAINAKNKEVRRKSQEPGAAERLLRNSCRDCD